MLISRHDPHKLLGAVALVTAVVLLSGAFGCKTGAGSSGWPAFRYQKCSADTPCPNPFVCESGHCVSSGGRYVMTTTTCASQKDCGYGMACLEDACVVDMMECVSDFDCSGETVCVKGDCVEEPRCERISGQPCMEERRWNE